MEALAKLLQIHPLFWPRTYVDIAVDVLDDRRVGLVIRDCPALRDNDGFTWFAQLPGDADRALGAIAWAVDRTATCSSRRDSRGAVHVEFVPGAEPTPVSEAPEVSLGKFSTGAAFEMPTPMPVLK